MTIIDEIAEDTRREMLQCQRRAIRFGAKMYAKSAQTRGNTLFNLGVMFSPALPLLKLQLKALINARSTGSWRYSQARYIAVMQCIGGELILASQTQTGATS